MCDAKDKQVFVHENGKRVALVDNPDPNNPNHWKQKTVNAYDYMNSAIPPRMKREKAA